MCGETCPRDFSCQERFFYWQKTLEGIGVGGAIKIRECSKREKSRQHKVYLIFYSEREDIPGGNQYQSGFQQQRNGFCYNQVLGGASREGASYKLWAQGLEKTRESTGDSEGITSLPQAVNQSWNRAGELGREATRAEAMTSSLGLQQVRDDPAAKEAGESKQPDLTLLHLERSPGISHWQKPNRSQRARTPQRSPRRPASWTGRRREEVGRVICRGK